MERGRFGSPLGSLRAAEGGKSGVDAMGKSRDKRRREAKELNELTIDVGSHASAEALAGSDPPTLGDPDVPVRAPLKPKPHIRSGAIAVPQPEPEDASLTANPKNSK